MLTPSPLGSLNFNVVRGIIEAHNAIINGAGIEVGVFDGGTSLYLLTSFPSLKLISVDPYKAYDEYDQERLNQAEANAYARLSRFGDRSVRLKEESVVAATLLPDGCFDFVFIDANHSYKAVSTDIDAWYPKVRPGGLFLGHDYRWDGVQRAVEEFSARTVLNGNFSPQESDVWWFVKPLHTR